MGRPREPVFQERTKLSVLLEKTEYEALRRLAKRGSSNMSQVARNAIKEKLKEYGEEF